MKYLNSLGVDGIGFGDMMMRTEVLPLPELTTGLLTARFKIWFIVLCFGILFLLPKQSSALVNGRDAQGIDGVFGFGGGSGVAISHNLALVSGHQLRNNVGVTSGYYRGVPSISVRSATAEQYGGYGYWSVHLAVRVFEDNTFDSSDAVKIPSFTDENQPQIGDFVLMVGFGGGKLTYGFSKIITFDKNAPGRTIVKVQHALGTQFRGGDSGSPLFLLNLDEIGIDKNLTDSEIFEALWSLDLASVKETLYQSKLIGILATIAGGGVIGNYFSTYSTMARDFLEKAALEAIDSEEEVMPVSDSDRDGVADNIDLDADNDGIPNALEGDGLVDSDQDGVFDYLDLDSDNDGLLDIVEAGWQSLDVDTDGRLDALDDADENGLHDSIIVDFQLPDGDQDGIPDFVDLDSDNDTLPDLVESQLPQFLLSNEGAITNDQRQFLNISEFGRPQVLLEPIDTDENGIPNYLDLDSDGDGILDEFDAFPQDATQAGLSLDEEPVVVEKSVVEELVTEVPVIEVPKSINNQTESPDREIRTDKSSGRISGIFLLMLSVLYTLKQFGSYWRSEN